MLATPLIRQNIPRSLEGDEDDSAKPEVDIESLHIDARTSLMPEERREIIGETMSPAAGRGTNLDCCLQAPPNYTCWHGICLSFRGQESKL